MLKRLNMPSSKQQEKNTSTEAHQDLVSVCKVIKSDLDRTIENFKKAFNFETEATQQERSRRPASVVKSQKPLRAAPSLTMTSGTELGLGSCSLQSEGMLMPFGQEEVSSSVKQVLAPAILLTKPVAPVAPPECYQELTIFDMLSQYHSSLPVHQRFYDVEAAQFDTVTTNFDFNTMEYVTEPVDQDQHPGGLNPARKPR